MLVVNRYWICGLIIFNNLCSIFRLIVSHLKLLLSLENLLFRHFFSGSMAPHKFFLILAFSQHFLLNEHLAKSQHKLLTTRNICSVLQVKSSDFRSRFYACQQSNTWFLSNGIIPATLNSALILDSSDQQYLKHFSTFQEICISVNTPLFFCYHWSNNTFRHAYFNGRKNDKSNDW